MRSLRLEYIKSELVAVREQTQLTLTEQVIALEIMYMYIHVYN